MGSRAGIVREHEDRHPVHGMTTAPTVGDLVGPPPEDEGAALGEHALHLVEVGARHGPEQRIAVLLLSGEVSVEEMHAAVSTERVGPAVVRASDEPVEGHGHVDDDLRHGNPPVSPLVVLSGHSRTRHARGSARPQLTAFFTSAPSFFSSAADNSFSANATGHRAPLSSFAASLKPNVAYRALNLSALWKKQMTLPSFA